jgi:uncharacterized protein YejL (UPF0352 family)
MPIQSKYSSQQIDTLMNDVIGVFEEHKADTQLSMMVLGNVLSNVLSQQANDEVKQALAEEFSRVLIKSIKS